MRMPWMLFALVYLGSLQADPVKPGESPRLKYKRGPVCMCSTGLTEQDIRAASGRWETPGSDAAPLPSSNKEENRRLKEKEE